MKQTYRLLFVLALLSHESAVLFGPLLALVIWNRRPGRRLSDWRMWRPAIIFTVLGAGYALIYQLLPISRA